MKPLKRIEMTRYPVAGWQTRFLASHGFEPAITGDRWFMVRR